MRGVKTVIAATLTEANQYSNSPQERTENRLTIVNTSTRLSVRTQGANPGNQASSNLAPATASMATTMTQ